MRRCLVLIQNLWEYYNTSKNCNAVLPPTIARARPLCITAFFGFAPDNVDHPEVYFKSPRNCPHSNRSPLYGLMSGRLAQRQSKCFVSGWSQLRFLFLLLVSQAKKSSLDVFAMQPKVLSPTGPPLLIVLFISGSFS